MKREAGSRGEFSELYALWAVQGSRHCSLMFLGEVASWEMCQGDKATRLQAGPCTVWTEGQCYRPDLPFSGSAEPSIQHSRSAWLLGLPATARPSPALLGHSAPVVASWISAFFNSRVVMADPH